MISLNEMYKETVTIFNKLKGVDALSKQDIWYKRVLTGVGWYTKSVSSVTGSTVNIGSKIQVLIPNNKGYIPYNIWKGNGLQTTGFTLSLNDYIVRGIVEEEVTAQTITKVLAAYEPNVCQIRGIRELPSRGIEFIQFSIEGV